MWRRRIALRPRAAASQISIRGGGHNIAGTSVCDGGVMIDLSTMTAGARRSRRPGAPSSSPGALLADVDRATLAHGLATPLGINSTTGVAGLTLGGGFGWLTRKHGLTDRQPGRRRAWSAPTASMRRASATENPDLFWAIRGGGGNFGVVTEFEFALHPIPGQVLAGLLVFPIDRTPGDPAAIPGLRRPGARGPERLGGAAQGAAAAVPAGRGARRRTSSCCAVFYTGDPADGASHVDQLRAFGPRLGEHVGASAVRRAGSRPSIRCSRAGARNYWKSHNFTALSDGAIDALADLRRPAAVGPQRDLRRAGVGGRQPRPDVGARLTSAATRSWW